MDIITYSKVQSLENETQENISNLISVVEGYDIYNATILENYFASYNTKAVVSFSGVNVAVIDVTRVVRFKYNYFIEQPDARGLFFEDVDGNKLDSYQTLTSPQEITVPANAAKCYVTVKTFDQIVTLEVMGAKPKELLRSQATYTNKTSGGITYAWSQDHSSVTVTGERTGTSFNSMYYNKTKLPNGMVNGGTYRFIMNAQSSKIYLTLIPIINGSEGTAVNLQGERTYTIPETWNGVDIRFMITGSGTVVNETIKCPEIYTIPDDKSMREEINDLKDAAYGESENPLAYIRKDAGLLSVFHTVGCIGDSLATGASTYKSGGTTYYLDNADFSWGQCLARLTGNTYYNFSQGGLSSRSWLASTHATTCFDGDHKCDAYFIGLGQNDKNNSIPVGTTADIDLEDYTQNEDTYCGNIGQIIQRLQILQPKAPIFVFTDPQPPTDDQAYNNVISDIVDLFDNVWIIDLKTYAGKQMFTDKSSIIGSQYRGGHYSAVGYQQIAFVIATYTDWIIRNNLSAFKQVEFIGTNYEWTD